MKKILCVLSLIFLFLGCGAVKKSGSYKISKHFTFSEATYSRKARRWHLGNYPKKDDYKRILYTARRMEDIRRIVGKELRINSWYRSKNVNRLVGGSRTSAHKSGLAVDFQISGNAYYALDRIKKSGYSFDQMIYHKKRNYIHISFRTNRRSERKKIYYYKK